MNIRKKAAAVAGSAVLLASIFSVAVAPAALASAVVGSAGTVPVGGTSTGTATFTFQENSAACFNTGGDSPALSIRIRDAASNTTVHFVGTPVVTAPGSLGATAAITGGNSNILAISFAASDPATIEQVSVTGLQISADTGAAPGAIETDLVNTGANPSPEASCVLPATVTATGTLAQNITSGGGTKTFLVTLTPGSCPFQLTTTSGNDLVFASDSDGKAITTAPPVVTGQQNLTITPGPANAHNIGEAVSEAGVTNCNLLFPAPLASAGTVANALTQTSTVGVILPGEQNQVGGTTDLSEAPAGTGTDYTAGEIVTFTISTPTTGVVFSGPEIANPSSGLDLGDGPGNVVPCSPNITRTACTVTVVSDAAGFDDILLTGVGGGINFDVAAGTPLGTPVNVVATTSTSYAVNLVSTLVANVGRTVVGVGAQPTIYMGFNAQQTGLITLQESGPGFFVAGLGGNNTFAVCLATGEIFTFAPFAVVTVAGGTPGLQLESGVNPATTVQGTLYDAGNCAYWTVYSPSTTGPATIEIRGSADGITPLPTGPNNGPTVNVPSFLAPGTTQMAILIGTSLGLGGGCDSVAGCETTSGFNSFATNAVRAFKNSVVVTAVTNPVVAPGTADGLAGNVTVTETQNGQFKPGDVVVFQYLPRATTTRNDLIIEPGNTNELPIFTTNTASGLLVSPVAVICPASALLGITFCAFTTTVVQQSFGPTLGQITVSNIHVQIAADAVLGPENLRVTNTGILGFTTPTGQSFDSVISNVTVGNAPTPTTITNASAVGVQNSGTFSTSTKIVPLNKYVTFQAITNLPTGTHITVWVAVKTNGVWSAFTPVTARVVNQFGVAYYYWRSSTPKWVSVKFSFAGNASWGPDTSLARQAETR